MKSEHRHELETNVLAKRLDAGDALTLQRGVDDVINQIRSRNARERKEQQRDADRTRRHRSGESHG